MVSRGTTSTLDLGTPAGQDRRRAAAFRKSYLMRIRRRDKDPAETAGPGEPEVVLYDYDEEGSAEPDPASSFVAEPVQAEPDPTPFQAPSPQLRTRSSRQPGATIEIECRPKNSSRPAISEGIV